MSFTIVVPAYTKYELKVKITRIILLLYRDLCLVLTKDVVRQIFPPWWKYYFCAFIHKQITDNTICFRHVLKYDLKTKLTIYQCRFCEAMEYQIAGDHKHQWSKYFPLLDKDDVVDYVNFLNRNIKLLVFFEGHEVMREVKTILFKDILVGYGPKPLMWNPYESFLQKWFDTEKARGYFRVQVYNQKQVLFLKKISK